MTQPSQDRNPFMLMLQPEVVLAAIEKSERLGQLNRHLCRPLDRPVLQGPAAVAEAPDDSDDEFDGTH
jgi:hypothetical protein